MTVWLSLLAAVVASEGSTTMARLSPSQMHFETCRTAALEHERADEPNEAIGVWKACRMEAERRGLQEFLPAVDGQIRLGEVQRDYAWLQKDDPLEYARVILATAASHPTEAFPLQTVQENWLLLIRDIDARQNLSNVKTVSIRWVDPAGGDEQMLQDLDAHVRRYVGDMGFKVPESNTGDAGDAAILIQAKPRFIRYSAKDPNQNGMWGAQVEIQTISVKYKDLDRRGATMKVARRVDDPSFSDASTTAMESSAEAFAGQLLLQVVGQLYGDYRMPER